MPRRNGAGTTLAVTRANHVRTSPERTRATLVEETSEAVVEEIKDDDNVPHPRKGTFLGFTTPTYPITIRGWLDSFQRGREQPFVQLPRKVWIRTLKSSVLVAKVCP